MYKEKLKSFITKKYFFVREIPIHEIEFLSTIDMLKTNIYEKCRKYDIHPVLGELICDRSVQVLEVFNTSYDVIEEMWELNGYDWDWNPDNTFKTSKNIKDEMNYRSYFLIQSDDISIMKYKLKF